MPAGCGTSGSHSPNFTTACGGQQDPTVIPDGVCTLHGGVPLLAKRGLMFLGTTLLVTLAVAACASVGQPDIELAQAATDLGEVRNGEVREFTVAVRNVGDGPLVIEAVTTSCGCTTATVTPETILPGESGSLNVAYDSGAHGPEFNGPVERQVFIDSNDPDEREVVFKLSVEVLLPAQQ
jgi:hypothetical protein